MGLCLSLGDGRWTWFVVCRHVVRSLLDHMVKVLMLLTTALARRSSNLSLDCCSQLFHSALQLFHLKVMILEMVIERLLMVLTPTLTMFNFSRYSPVWRLRLLLTHSGTEVPWSGAVDAIRKQHWNVFHLLCKIIYFCL